MPCWPPRRTNRLGRQRIFPHLFVLPVRVGRVDPCRNRCPRGLFLACRRTGPLCLDKTRGCVAGTAGSRCLAVARAPLAGFGRRAEELEDVPVAASPRSALPAQGARAPSANRDLSRRRRAGTAQPVKRPEWLPPLDYLRPILGLSCRWRAAYSANARQRAQLIKQTLAEFGVPVEVVSIKEGPTVTQFGLEPGEIVRELRNGEVLRRRVSVQRIHRLSNDLALALAAASTPHRGAGAGPAVRGHRGPQHDQDDGHPAQRPGIQNLCRSAIRRWRWRWAAMCPAIPSWPT